MKITPNCAEPFNPAQRQRAISASNRPPRRRCAVPPAKSPDAAKERNRIRRMIGRLRNNRALATRPDKPAGFALR
jgi:hypothetical protein